MATRARKGEGSITYRKSDGRYEAKLWITAKDGTKARKTVYGKTRQDVKEKLRDLKAKDLAGRFMTSKEQRLETFFSEWLPKAPKINEATRIKYATTVRKYLNPHLGKIKLSDLTTAQIQQMMDSHIEQGVGTRTLQINRCTLSSALSYAKARGLVKENVVKGVILPEYRPEEKEFWSKEQTQKFRETAKEVSKLYPIYELYMTYGLRRGEALGLCWEHIDFEQGFIKICQQLTYVGKEVKICPTKTKNSERQLPITKNVKDILEKIKPKNASGLVFKLDNGDWIKPSVLQYDFEKTIKAAKLPYRTLHSLRHFVATGFERLKVSLKDAQKILGHADISTTINYYQHSTFETKKEALERYSDSMQF
ncbi:site-specific integrase [Christensenellaceae bacterium OttesenSCG-928-L17]|nr:site-specific integrase [Christensenellaceae bacterium OttesenSCG-928-L17]